MIPLNPWEYQNSIKALYSKCVGAVCTKHEITRMELDILLFLANNPCYDTATDIVEIRYLSKSQVSGSVKTLEARGYLKKEYAEDNRKTAHLKICREAASVIEDGKAAQEKFIAIMLQGIGQEEVECIQRYFRKVRENIDNYLKEDMEDVSIFNLFSCRDRSRAGNGVCRYECGGRDQSHADHFSGYSGL